MEPVAEEGSNRKGRYHPYDRASLAPAPTRPRVDRSLIERPFMVDCPTAEQMAKYHAQVEQSDGFDVDPVISKEVMFGLIHPVNLTNRKEECEILAKLAVDEFNKKYKDTKGEMVFDKVVKAMANATRGIRYYLTFDAILQGKTIACQAVVLYGIRVIDVQSFRFNPTSGPEKWLWENHLCRCCQKPDA